MRLAPRAWCVLLLTLGLADAGLASEQSDTFVFVGRLVSIEERPDPCEAKRDETGALTCVTMDALYRARYEIVLPLVGDYGSNEIRFHIADHYGFPSMALYRHALLFVGLDSDEPYLHKYQGFAVHRTTEGQWASCGELYYRDDDEPVPSAVQRLTFENDFGTVGELSDAGVREEFDPVDYAVTDGRIRCIRGILLPDMYEIARTGALDARGLKLPEWAEIRP